MLFSQSLLLPEGKDKKWKVKESSQLKRYFIFFFPDQEEYDNPFFGASKCIRKETLQQFEFSYLKS
jgi:hypothetical protein